MSEGGQGGAVAAGLLFGGALLGAGALLFSWARRRGPVASLEVTEEHKGKKAYTRKGVDVVAPMGTEIRAPFKGTVHHLRSDRAGYILHLERPDGTALRFFHLSAYTTPDGAEVEEDALIGLTGNSGQGPGGESLPAHLYIEGRRGGLDVDPRELWPDWPWEGGA